MKKFLTFLSVLCLVVPAFGQPFEPTDKVMYFNAEAVQTAIKQTIPQENQIMAAERYVELMDSESGKISAQDLKTICTESNLTDDGCQKFLTVLYSQNVPNLQNGISDSTAFIKGKDGMIVSSYKSTCNAIKDPKAYGFEILDRPTGVNCWCTSTSKLNDTWHYMTSYKSIQECSKLCNETCTRLYKGD